MCIIARVITLYQLHWSHFVEKVRWALDFKGVEWRAIDVDPFTKREMRHLKSRTTLESGQRIHTVPTISDDATGVVTTGSADILDYLERTFPTPALFPADALERTEVQRWVLWFDSTLGLAARRLAYTHIALEHPGLLAELFLPRVFPEGAGQSAKGKVVGIVIAGVLARRFRFAHNRTDRIYEELARCLRSAAHKLKGRRYLVGDSFSAADLTLAGLMRPVAAIPYFRELPELRELFEWRATLLRAHGRHAQSGYERAIHEMRQRRGYALGRPAWIPALAAVDEPVAAPPPEIASARNDQQPMGRWPVLMAPFTFLGLKLTCKLPRIAYAALETHNG